MTRATETRRRVAARVGQLALTAVLVTLPLYWLADAARAGFLGRSTRMACANNLKQIGMACLAYAADNQQQFPTAYSKDSAAWNDVGNTRTDQQNPAKKEAKAGGKAADLGANVAIQSNTAGLWLLLKAGLIDKPDTFLCPESVQKADAVADVAPFRDFRGEGFCSYSYQNTLSLPDGNGRRYVLTVAASTGLAIAADANPMRRDFWSKAPGGGAADGATDKQLVAKPTFSGLGQDGEIMADPWDLNSPNHGFKGQNVLYLDGHVEFTTHPYCGYQYDNLWLRRAAPKADAAPPDPKKVATLQAFNDVKSYDGKAGVVAGTRTDSFLVP
jgi:prepilin-type processing-associated H-X9-DG protein